MTILIGKFRWENGALVPDEKGDVNLATPTAKIYSETYTQYTKIEPVIEHRWVLSDYLNDLPIKSETVGCFCAYCRALGIVKNADRRIRDGEG